MQALVADIDHADQIAFLETDRPDYGKFGFEVVRLVLKDSITAIVPDVWLI
jgi:hypothetical protein